MYRLGGRAATDDFPPLPYPRTTIFVTTTHPADTAAAAGAVVAAAGGSILETVTTYNPHNPGEREPKMEINITNSMKIMDRIQIRIQMRE